MCLCARVNYLSSQANIVGCATTKTSAALNKRRCTNSRCSVRNPILSLSLYTRIRDQNFIFECQKWRTVSVASFSPTLVRTYFVYLMLHRMNGTGKFTLSNFSSIKLTHNFVHRFYFEFSLAVSHVNLRVSFVYTCFFLSPLVCRPCI